MKPIHLFMFVLLAACGVKHSSVDFGKTSVADLVSMKGQPIEEKDIPVKDSKVLVFEDNEKFQTSGDIVTHGFRDPKGDQKSLLYWKHKFKDCETINKKISHPKGHELLEYELDCPAEGTKVIYTDGSEYVSRVVEYEKN